MSFAEEYKRLNTRQKEAVDTIDGPVLVIAGPGTGKTQLLAVRVANILQNTDADPQNILCLTFTNKAALNMRDRLLSLIGPEARKIEVRTFHSFAADIMNRYPDCFWSGAELSVAPDAVQEDIIQTILSELPSDNPLATFFAGSYTALPGVKESLKLAKEAGLNPDELKQIITENIAYLDQIEDKLTSILSMTLKTKSLGSLQEKINALPKHKTSHSFLLPLSSVLSEGLAQAIEQDEPTGKTTQTGKWKRRWIQTVQGKKGMFDERRRNEWWLAIADLYETYRNQLHGRGYYDYSDMLVEVLEQLQKNPAMLSDIQERYLYVLIDEFQDTNAAQLRLAHTVADHYAANNRPNIMAVGDDDQSIFAFNGAELNNMLYFIRSYPETKVVVLEDNYRSDQKILDSATAVIQLASDRLINREKNLIKNLFAKQEYPKSSVLYTHYPTQDHQFTATARHIKNLWGKGERSIAVLARKHGSLQRMAHILQTSDIPLHYEQQQNVLEHEAVRQLHLMAQTVAAIEQGDKNATNLHLSELLRHPMWELEPTTLWKIALDNFSSPDYLGTLLQSDSTHLQAIGNWLSWLSRTYQSQPLPLFMEYAIGLSKGQYLESPFKKYYLSSESLSSEYLETLSAVEMLISLCREFSSKSNASLQDFVRFVQLNLSTGRVIANQSWFANSDEAVELLTVHKAKGLEYDHVFLVDATESAWSPRASRRKSPANLQLQSYGEQDDDYVRLLFVAISRAKRTFVASSYQTDEKGSELLPTPLLSSIESKTITQPTDEPMLVLETNLQWPALHTKDERALLQERLDSFALSPTALLDFLDITTAGPGVFKERHLLRLPHAQSIDGVYGTAVHAALETAQRLVNTSTLNENTVLDRFEKSLEQSHIAPQDFRRLMTRGTNLLPELLKHAALLTPKSALSEQKLEGTLARGTRIKGTIDSIFQTNDQLLISDFKTGKPLHSFETKDKTKRVKAWRHHTQLLFYALLVHESGRFKLDHIRTRMLYVEADNESNMELGLTPQAENLERLSRLIAKVFEHIQNLDFPDISAYETSAEGILQFENDLLSGKI